MDAAIIFANKFVNTKYEDIPANALEVAKKQILDVLGVTMAGSAAEGCREVVELIKEWGGKKESTVLAYGGKVPAPNASITNATMCDALDYDDTNDISAVHSGAVLIPAYLAMAEREGNISGKDFLTAVTLGVDMVHRMGLAAKPYSDSTEPLGGWEPTPLYGCLACAAGAGKLLQLDEDKMINAIGIAYAQTSGNMQCMRDGALTKRLQLGFAARAGTLSAIMAERGITGARNSLEGVCGLYNVYHRGRYDPDALTGDLGKRFEGVNICFKPYPSCRGNHSAIDATLALTKEHALKPEDVTEVTVFVGKLTYTLCEPLGRKRNPRNTVDAQFSIPWNVATAIVKGKVAIDSFMAEALEDRSVCQMAEKVTPKLDENLGPHFVEPALVEIRTNDGRVLSRRVDFPTGSPQNPMSWQDIIDKFRDCASYAVRPISKGNLEKVSEMVKALEEVNDVSSLIPLLS